MALTRTTREDVIRAAGRLFAERGYHGTSMRDLGGELGLHGSSLYSHITSKEALLVAVVERGARLFDASASAALAGGGGPEQLLRTLICGHLDVVLDNLDEARTFLNEARVLEDDHRAPVVMARDRYEAAFRSVLAEGAALGVFTPGLDPRTSAIFILSILNSIDRWYRPDGELDRPALVDRVAGFVLDGLRPR